jgi:hypothetical protein
MTTHAAFFGVMFMLLPQKRQERILRRIRAHGRLQCPAVRGRAGNRQTEVSPPREIGARSCEHASGGDDDSARSLILASTASTPRRGVQPPAIALSKPPLDPIG